MINNLEGMSKRELLEIIQIQQETDIELSRYIKTLEDHNGKMKLALMKALDRWWPIVHGAVFVSDTTKNLRVEIRNAIENK
ncbi:hypothetical protein [Alteromonas sp. RKMC-009]|uniref:hypothetical protein n=1 Tax=Alteromonas sp. RKMC-009 TaxID=2267264 RepID=UPI000E682150|nr:hypothetical protein [Alteromonas sp. RKMC-009]AYA64288.1 hypothetical protein DS731_09935 [Alteromonas sp. RKMC-009]